VWSVAPASVGRTRPGAYEPTMAHRASRLA
jgi:hypothetical protein